MHTQPVIATSRVITGLFSSPFQSGTQVFTSTRSKLNEQLSKLQSKHNAEVELLEDLKQFTRQRSALEKNYSEVS